MNESKTELLPGACECSCGTAYNPLPSQRSTRNACPDCRRAERKARAERKQRGFIDQAQNMIKWGA